MSLLSDIDIRQAVIAGELKIEPFVDRQVRDGNISYGLGHAGVDLRLGRKFKVFTDTYCSFVDPKNFDKRSFVDIEGDYCLIPPNSFLLAEVIEKLTLPNNMSGLVTLKSTYARIGVCSPPTIAEPSWSGILTLEIANVTPLPIKIYANEGIVQLLLFKLSSPCAVNYADKKGIYQDQKGITLPKVKTGG